MKKLHAALCKLISKLHGNKADGATMVEYGLLVGLIAIACVAILQTLGVDFANLFTTVDTDINTAAAS